MPSPFPGMNPYLEQEDVWQDFHDRMIPAISDALSPQVSPHFIVRIEEHFYLHEPAAEQRIRKGVVISSVIDIEKQNYLEIRNPLTRSLVAVVELLTPMKKKAGPDRDQYVTKRLKLLCSQAHFVEIDLLRGWSRMPFETPLACDYCILVSRAENRPKVGVWLLSLRDRLPVIPIPLKPPLTEAHLDLQEILHDVYDRAYYKDDIYLGKPTPQLNPEDAAWADSILAKYSARGQD